MSELNEAFQMRAIAHVKDRANLSARRRWRNGVTDLEVAAVLYVMEADGVTLALSATDRWREPAGRSNPHLRGVKLGPVVHEMIRTGLLRAWTDLDGTRRVTPAKVHLADALTPGLTVCHDPVESMPEGRVRALDDLTLVDCLDCEREVARKVHRELSEARTPVRHLRAL